MSKLTTFHPHLLPAVLGIVVVISVIGSSYFVFQKPAIAPTPSAPEQSGSQQLTPGEPLAAELAGLSFLDLVFAYSTDAKPETEDRILQFFSPELSAKFANSSENLETQLLALLQLTLWPDQGFSEEDLQFRETSASLIVGFNYSSKPRLLREIYLVNHEGKWLVSGIQTLATYPPENATD